MDLDKLSEMADEVKTGVIPSNPLHTLHIDGDYCAYFYAGNDKTPLDTAWDNFVTRLNQLVTQFGIGGRAILHLTAGDSDKGQRYHIATVQPYQGKRDHSSRPKNWEGMRNRMESWIGQTIPGTKIKVKSWSDREADDGASYAAHLELRTGSIPYLFYRDKDWRMIPARHITWDDWDVVDTTHAQNAWAVEHGGKLYGLKWFYHQLIEGDDVDNIPGLPGQLKKDGKSFKNCGATCAKEKLAYAEGMNMAYAATLHAYQTYYGYEGTKAYDALAEQAGLLWMNRQGKFDVLDFMFAFPPDPLLIEAAYRLKDRLP